MRRSHVAWAALAILLPHLRSYSLIDVLGPPVQYLVNVTPRTDRLLVTLCNNSPQTWEGFIRPRRTGVRRAANWMTDGELAAGRMVEVGVPPLDAVVVELLLEEPSFEVRQA